MSTTASPVLCRWQSGNTDMKPRGLPIQVLGPLQWTQPGTSTAAAQWKGDGFLGKSGQKKYDSAIFSPFSVFFGGEQSELHRSKMKMVLLWGIHKLYNGAGLIWSTKFKQSQNTWDVAAKHGWIDKLFELFNSCFTIFLPISRRIRLSCPSYRTDSATGGTPRAPVWNLQACQPQGPLGGGVKSKFHGEGAGFIWVCLKIVYP